MEDTQAEGKAEWQDKQLYVANAETCLHNTNDQWAEVEGIQSDQEGADTRIIYMQLMPQQSATERL